MLTLGLKNVLGSSNVAQSGDAPVDLNVYHGIITVGSSGSNFGFLGGGVGAIDPTTFNGVPITFSGSFGENWMRVDIAQIPNVTKLNVTLGGQTWVLNWYDPDRYAGTAPFNLWDFFGTTVGVGNETPITLKYD